MNKYKQSLIIFSSLLIVTTLMTLKVPGFFYIYLLVLGAIIAFCVLKNSDQARLTYIVLSAFIWGSGAVILLSSFFAFFSIPIRLYILWLPVLLLIPLLWLRPVNLSKLFIKPDKWEVLLLVFAVASVLSHVLSITAFETPMLHDPMTHASRAKEIFNTGLINYFYSPGLHILSALGMMTDGVNVASYILVITNLFNALGFIPVYLFILNTFKNQWFAILSGVIFLIAPFPSDFFWRSGKNALVIAIPFMFFLLYVASLMIDRRLKLVIVNVLAFTLVLVHYPTAAVGLIGVFFVLLVTDGIKGISNMIIGGLLGGVWGLQKMKYEVATMQGDVVSVTSAPDISFESLGNFFKDIYPHITSQYQFPLNDLFFIVGLIGLFLMTLMIIKDRKYFSVTGFVLGYLLLMFIIKSTILITFLYVVYESQLVTFFIFIYIGVAFVIGKGLFTWLSDQKQILNAVVIFFVLSIVIVRQAEIFQVYRSEQSAKNMVSENDLRAFEWISENVDQNDIILNNAQKNSKQIFVFASDGGAWIPVYTDHKIAMPFTEFTAKNTHENYEVYLRIREGTYTCSDIDFFLNKGIKYYYKDSQPVYGPQFDVSEDEVGFELKKSFDSATIYEIVPCD